MYASKLSITAQNIFLLQVRGRYNALLILAASKGLWGLYVWSDPNRRKGSKCTIYPPTHPFFGSHRGSYVWDLYMSIRPMLGNRGGASTTGWEATMSPCGRPHSAIIPSIVIAVVNTQTRIRSPTCDGDGKKEKRNCRGILYYQSGGGNMCNFFFGGAFL